MAGTFLSILGVFLIFGSVLFLAYSGTKFFGIKAGKLMKGKNISIVETVGIGIDKQLHLVKVGEKFILLSTSGKNIQMLTEVKPEELGEMNFQSSETVSGVDFKELFDKYVGLFQKKVNTKKIINKKTDIQKTDNEKIDTNTKAKNASNLDRIRQINNQLKKPYIDSGDETGYDETNDKG